MEISPLKDAAAVGLQSWNEILERLARHYGIACPNYKRDDAALAGDSLETRVERLAQQYGLEAKPVDPQANSILARRLPMLLLLRTGEIGLALAADKDRIKITFSGDNGQWTWLDKGAIGDDLTGLFMVRDGRDNRGIREDAEDDGSKGWFRRLALQDCRPYAYVLLASLVANSLSMAGVMFSMQVYDRVVPANAMNTLFVLFAGVLLAGCFDFLMRRVRTAIIDVMGKQTDLRLSKRVFGHALRVKNQNKPKSVGSFIAQLRDLEQVRELLTSTTVAAVADLPFFFLFLGIFAAIGGWLAVIPAASLLLLVAPGILVQGRLRRLAGEAMRESSLRNAMLVEAVQGHEDIKTLQAEMRFEEKWNAFNTATAGAQLRLRSLTSTLTSWGHAVQTTVFAVIVFFGAPSVMAGDMTTGSLVACSILGSRMMAPMAQLTQVLSRLQHAVIGLRGLDRIMQMPVDHPVGETRISVGALQGEYRFRGAAFHYGEPVGRPPLTLEDFTVKAGDTVAVLGKNGAGKSSLLQAMAGLLEPASGEALVDGLAIAQLDPVDLRREVGLLTQQSRLFHGTVRENLLLGAPDASQEALLHALSMTGADSFIRQLPRGLDHLVDEGGRGLSGGQQQALLLSRLLIRNPSILLLDEPTAAMDDAAERHFINELQIWGRGKTLVIATHRMRILDLAARIVVMDGGRVVLNKAKEEALRKLGQAVGDKERQGDDARPAMPPGRRRPARVATPATAMASRAAQ